jgi:hypothetical protein
MNKNKIFYIDNLKVGLISLVVLHHATITYGAAGAWYYSEKTTLAAANTPMTLLVIINQSFFMGFFFFLSAYFIPGSYHRKGAVRFVKDRLLRLGIPLLFYSFILSPVIIYLVYYFGQGHHITFWQFLSGFDDWIDFGVLWFVAALLLFTLIYVVWRSVQVIWRFASHTNPPKPRPAPSPKMILWFAAAVGALSFAVRIVFPVGRTLNPVGFQLAHFPPYVALFVLGLVAYENNWLETFPYDKGKRFARYAPRLLLLLLVIFVLGKTAGTPDAWYTGGFHWQQLLYAVWEQLTGFSIIVALLAFGKKLWNRSSPLMAKLSRNAFAVYIFHPLVLVAIALLLRNWGVDPAIKFLLLAPLGIAGSFLLASVLTSLPGVRKVI